MKTYGVSSFIPKGFRGVLRNGEFCCAKDLEVSGGFEWEITEIEGPFYDATKNLYPGDLVTIKRNKLYKFKPNVRNIA